MDIEAKFAADFAQSWKLAERELAKAGLSVGSKVRNRDGILFRITAIQPKVYNFGNPPDAAIMVYGVRFRADSTWGTHQHWIGHAAGLRGR